MADSGTLTTRTALSSSLEPPVETACAPQRGLPLTGGSSVDATPSGLTARASTLQVEAGDATDECPLCGIHRQNAGFLKETCGDGYLKPDCFVKETSA